MTFGALTAFIAIAMTHLLTSLREDLICRRINALAAKFTVVAITLRFAWNSVAARLYNVSKDKVTLLDGGSKRRSRASAVAPSSIGVGG